MPNQSWEIIQNGHTCFYPSAHKAGGVLSSPASVRPSVCLSVKAACQFEADDILLYKLAIKVFIGNLFYNKEERRNFSSYFIREEDTKKSNILWIWRLINGLQPTNMKKTRQRRRKKQVCGAACFIAVDANLLKMSVCLSVTLSFPDDNSRRIWPIAMKFYTKLYWVEFRFPIDFQGHPSNFKVTRARKVSILANFTTFWPFPDDNSSFILQMALKFYSSLPKVWNGIPIVFQGHPSIFKVMQGSKSVDFALFWVIPDDN